jgi:DNA mismatch endonuclease, patch repair protein
VADVHDKATRSYNMSMIKGKNTKPEMIVRKFLHANGFRYRLHVKDLPGKPDIVLPKYKTVIFVHGCFWHGHSKCDLFVMPKSNTNYWIPKINNNKLRDRNAQKTLKTLGWKTITIWECQLRSNSLNRILNNLINAL